MAYEVRVKPVEWSHRGDAIAKAPGRNPLAIFGGIPGEKAVVRVNHDGHHQSHGVFAEAIEAHPTRVEAPCGKVERCGGCPVMHVNAEGQEGLRRTLVRQFLDAEGLEEVVLGDFHACPDGLTDYRHILKLGTERNNAGALKVGGWGRLNRRVVPIPECPVVAPVLRKTMVSVAHWLIKFNIEPYDPETERGVLRAVILRASRTTGEVLVTLITGRRPKMLGELAVEIGQGVSEVVGVWVHVNKQPGNGLYELDEDGKIHVSQLAGRPLLEETLGDVTYKIGAGDFFQTNPATAEVLYKRVIDRLELVEGDPVVDLYCGVGGLALQAAKKTGWALGVEEILGAVTRARETARTNRITAEFIVGEVADIVPEVEKRLNGARPIITVNPARRGLEEGVVNQITALKPRKVAYVSCNPRALARDLALFQAKGFEIGEVEMFDMFPNTPHVETLVVLTAPDANEGPGRRAPRRRSVKRRS